MDKTNIVEMSRREDGLDPLTELLLRGAQDLIQLPTYCPHLNPIERLWAVLHQYVTHNRYYPSQKQFADAILAFMRETIPQEWKNFRDKVSDNFRVITHENFRVLK